MSTLHQFRLSQLQRNPTLVIFNIQGLLEHSRPTKRDLPISYHAFPHDVALCPMVTLDAYLYAREKLENAALHDELFICYRKPHGPTTKDTLPRWVKIVLHSSGVNLDTFSAHSCRSASTSKAAATGVPLEKILLAGQWSTSSTFYTFYRKDIVVTGRLPGPQFASGLLTQNANGVEQIFYRDYTLHCCIYFSCVDNINTVARNNLLISCDLLICQSGVL